MQPKFAHLIAPLSLFTIVLVGCFALTHAYPRLEGVPFIAAGNLSIACIKIMSGGETRHRLPSLAIGVVSMVTLAWGIGTVSAMFRGPGTPLFPLPLFILSVVGCSLVALPLLMCIDRRDQRHSADDSTSLP